MLESPSKSATQTTKDTSNHPNSVLRRTADYFGAFNFDQLKTEDFMPAFESSMKEAKGFLEEIKSYEVGSDAMANFSAVVEKLESCTHELGHVSNIFYGLFSAQSDEALRALGEKVSPLLSSFFNDILLDEKLFSQLEKVHAQFEAKEGEGLSGEQKMLLKKTYKDFVHHGAKLQGEKKEQLRKWDEELSREQVLFGNNVLKSSDAFELLVTEEAKLAGLSESFLRKAQELAKTKGKGDGYLLKLDYPTVIEVSKNAESRELRKEMYLAFNSRSLGGEFDNRGHIKKIIELREKKAKLLGHADFASFVLQDRMAQHTDRVWEFLNNIKAKAMPKAKADLAEVKAMKEDGEQDFQPWDYAYYAEKLKKQKLDFNDEVLKPYFQLEKVMDGLFYVLKNLYGLDFHKLEGVSTYHPDVDVYRVTEESGAHLGLFYFDFFARPGEKNNGAWMTNLRNQRVGAGQVDERPHVMIVCNFPKGDKLTPSLLTLQDVLTLFHEAGHALHGLLTKCQYESLSGTNVLWDFVELPSQILENWVYEKECLQKFATHYETGAPLPAVYLEKIKESITFQEGYATMRQLNFACLDMSYHTEGLKEGESVEDFEKRATTDTRLFDAVGGTNSSCAFSHIFQGGYAAGYYSYKWAECLEADCFELFKEKGIFNKTVASNFKTLLERGGTVEPLDLFVNFRGREPDVSALLKRGGLI